MNRFLRGGEAGGKAGTVLAVWAAGLVLQTAVAAGGASAPAATRSAAAAPPSLAVAFPKTYDRYETSKLYIGLLDHVARCAAVRLVNLRGDPIERGPEMLDLLSEKDMLEALKTGRLQLAQVTAGLVPVAMDSTDARPFAVRGDGATGNASTYRLNLIVKAESPYRAPTDLKGRKIAHTTPGSNSGNLAPRAYFPGLGLTPDTDYTVIYSRGHERSIVGVLHGFYDGAAVASDQFQRMIRKGEVSASSFRVLWESPPFPAEAWMLSGRVPAALRDKVVRCVGDYRIPASLVPLLEGADRYVPIEPEKAYEPVRFVLSKSRPAAR